LTIGKYRFEVRFAPGHSLGHVIFYCSAAVTLFSGDVVFQGSIGRTDLPGGSYDTLMCSIHKQVLTLPDETRILSGHGPETNVGNERRDNPFLQ
jgi:glyoxylase-like metal-dependent hydrolase (beta-lactamase superfamily II)